ncbi:glutaredoxin family protein [Marinomonas piezotolerans]|uniref:Glutaredoxin family protein n=1 Tax=Marinomonas piezotolerans TaxID=2213058 RepID=A0A370UDR3_9GAMM|nr:glutaredoxin family protein [Marinomonas piezotolerans]RDL45927.1 glutaredoxin family protein [Marinomonas piezotolerans]
MPELLLFGTLGCHLCDEAETLLKQWFGNELTLKSIDIADSEDLVEKYGLRIPVISDGVNEQDWPFDKERCAGLLVKGNIDLSSWQDGKSSTTARRVLCISTKK